MFGWKREFHAWKQIDHDVDSYTIYIYHVICFPLEHCGRLFAMFGCYCRVDCTLLCQTWMTQVLFFWVVSRHFFQISGRWPPKKLSFQVVSSPGPRCSQGGWRRRLRPWGAVAIPCVEAMMTVYKFAWIEFEAVYYTLPTYIYICVYIYTHTHTCIYDI